MQKGVIVKGIGGFYYVDTGEGIYECRARGKFRISNITPLIGDHVEIDGDPQSLKGYIISVDERKNQLIRPSVANIDQVVIVFAAKKPDINMLLMQKFLIYSEFKKYRFGLIRSIRSGLLRLMKIGSDAGMRFNEYDRFTLETHKRIMKDNHQYIMLIGVDPNQQGQGYGSRLMLPVLKAAEEKGQACYLETHNSKNVSFYEKFGFKVVSEDVLPGTDIIQYAMVKESISGQL
jgi:ribosomal protein S18 acetylase RimI-like enzyme